MARIDSMCPGCEAERNDALREMKTNVIKQAIGKAKQEGLNEIAVVKSKNGTSWMVREADDPACERLPEVLFVYVV